MTLVLQKHNTPEVRKNRLPFGIPWIPQGLSAALLVSAFVLGVGTGVTVDSAINTNPKVKKRPGQGVWGKSGSVRSGCDRCTRLDGWWRVFFPYTHSLPRHANPNEQDLASRDAIDKNAPNPKFCQRYGASTLVLDHRIFVSFNPFSIYVTQADVKPGCVLRAANVVQVLQGRGLLTDEEVSMGEKRRWERGMCRVGG